MSAVNYGKSCYRSSTGKPWAQQWQELSVWVRIGQGESQIFRRKWHRFVSLLAQIPVGTKGCLMKASFPPLCPSASTPFRRQPKQEWCSESWAWGKGVGLGGTGAVGEPQSSQWWGRTWQVCKTEEVKGGGLADLRGLVENIKQFQFCPSISGNHWKIFSRKAKIRLSFY